MWQHDQVPFVNIELLVFTFNVVLLIFTFNIDLLVRATYIKKSYKSKNTRSTTSHIFSYVKPW